VYHPAVPTIQLSALDISLVVIYLIGITGLGLWVSRGVNTSYEFFLSGRSLPF